MSVLGTGVIRTDWSQGLIGAVNTTGSASAGPIITQLNIGGTPTNLSSDARIIGFKWGSDYYALVSSYAYNPPGVPGSAYIAFFKYVSGAWVQQVVKDSATWGFSNPYSLIVVDDDMYVLDYDSGKITKVDLTDNSTTVIYTAPNKIISSTTYLPHGSAMDIDTAENALLAVFSYLPSGAYQPYAPSTAAYFPLPGSSAAAASNSDLNSNAVAVTIDSAEARAYVSSIGGPQVSGGNANSKIETIDLTDPGLAVIGTPVVPSATVFNAGDFLDAVPYNSGWYLLQAHWYDVPPNDFYVGYNYRVTQTTNVKLENGTAGNSADTVNTGTVNVTPAEATWLLAPAVDALWFVNGVAANTLTISSSIALAQKANAGQLAGDAVNYGHINTASVIIDVPDAAPKAAPLKATVGRAISRTKVAFRFAPVKEEEK